jgi:predicted ATPase/DNA-binding SARP family transcriptional activator
VKAAAPDRPRLALFGTATIVPAGAGGQAARPFAPERLFQMAALLAARRSWTAREQITALLWPDLPSESARRNLRKLIHRAQQQPWFGAEVRPDALRWLVDSDVAEFDAAIAAGDWAGAVDRYGGLFLDGMEHAASAPYQEWLAFERTRLAAAFRDAAARRFEQVGADPVARIDVATRWLQQEPFDEDALVALAGALRAGGREAEAARAQQAFVERLTVEIGVEPSVRVRALARPPAASGAVASAPPVPQTQDAGLVGRRSELQVLAGLLERPECRLLTITGPGGIGKSRIARAALAQVAARYPDGIWWIGLEDLSEVSQVSWRVAGVLGFDLAGAADPARQLIERLRPRRALLVLDNSEHLGELAGFVATLLAECPGVQMLSTSRARLDVPGEWLLPLGGLPVPDEDETELDALRAFDAVRLFELRAAAAMPAFDPVANAREVARLARAVDGMPLAIELAAAWVRLLPVAEIRAEIERSLDLLAQSAAGRPDRHQSVRASFAHSWNLLGPREQETLARLSVFGGPFTRAAAAQVADAALPLLAALVDHSLLRADGDGRFSFHALMHQCAREQLDADPPAARARANRHADFFAQLLARHTVMATGRKEIVGEIEAALADCRAAWHWSIAQGAVARLDTMTEPLMRFFEVRGRWNDGLALLDAALAQGAGEAGRERTMPPSMLGWRAALLFRKGETLAAQEAAAAGLERARSLRRRSDMRLCLQVLGLAWWQQGATQVARRCFENALAVAESVGDDTARAPHLHGVAMCARTEGDFAAAIRAYEQVLALYRGTGSPQGQAMTLDNIATTYRALRDFDAARRYSESCLRLTEEHGLALVRTYALLNLALTEMELGRFDAARACLAQARALDSAAGEGMVSSDLQLVLGRLELRSGHPEIALPLLREGLAMARKRLEEPVLLAAVGTFAEYESLHGDRQLAATYWKFVLAHPLAEAGDLEDARRGLAALALSPPQAEQAERAAAGLTLEVLASRLQGGG